MRLCPLGFAVACVCGLTYFHRKMMSKVTSVHLLLTVMFLTFCKAFFAKTLLKMIVLHSLWHFRLNYPNSLKNIFEQFEFLVLFPSKINELVVVDVNSADAACLLIGLPECEIWISGGCWTTGNGFWVKKCVAMFCDWLNCCGNGLF